MTVPEVKDIRYYKGKYKVQILLKSKSNYGVKALEFIPDFMENREQFENNVVMFTTVPRLLWRHPRK